MVAGVVSTKAFKGGNEMFGRSQVDSTQAPGIAPDDVPEGLDRAAFAAGCFWGVEEFFRAIPGVTDAISGYEGGQADHPTYEQVCSGTTGHAEAVLVTFDPSQVSFERLLEEFWRHHDPTTPNRQGPDRGTQYRSAVFSHNETQEEAVRASLDEYQSRFTRPIVTEVAAATVFWPAEEHHQRFTEKTGQGGCHVANW
jgi:peptide-methionine (S)-S-oxide reductase